MSLARTCKFLRSYSLTYSLNALLHSIKDAFPTLLKRIFGLPKRADYWGQTFRGHLEDDLCIQFCISDAAFFYKQLRRALELLWLTYVDDKLQAGTQPYEHLRSRTGAKFLCKEMKYDYVQFAGFKVEQKEDMFVIHQKPCTSNLYKLNYKISLAESRSLRGKLLWKTISKHDIYCSVALLDNSFQNEGWCHPQISKHL